MAENPCVRELDAKPGNGCELAKEPCCSNEHYFYILDSDIGLNFVGELVQVYAVKFPSFYHLKEILPLNTSLSVLPEEISPPFHEVGAHIMFERLLI